MPSTLTPMALSQLLLPLCGCSASVGPSPRSLLLPAQDGWMLAASGAAPPSTPKASAARPRERGMLQHVLCARALLEALFIFVAPWAAQGGGGSLCRRPRAMSIPCGWGLACWWACAHGVKGEDPCLQRSLVCSMVRGRPRVRRHLGEGEPCVLAYTCDDHGVTLAWAVLTAPCDQDLGKQQGVKS